MAHKETTSHGVAPVFPFDRSPHDRTASPSDERDTAGGAHAPTIAENLARLRRERRLSLHMLAHASGISEFVLARIEDGSEQPEIRLLWSVANALGVPFSELLRDPADRPRKPAEQPRVLKRSVVATTPGARSSTSLYELTFPVGASEILPASEADMVEQLLVTAGRFHLSHGGREHELTLGESVVLHADGERVLANGGDTVAVAYLKLTPRT